MSLIAVRVAPECVELVTDSIAYGGDDGAVRFRADSPKRTLVARARSVIADCGSTILGDMWSAWSELVDADDVDDLAAAAARDHAVVYEAAQQRADSVTDAAGRPGVQMHGGRVIAGWSNEHGGYRAFLQYNSPQLLTFDQLGKTMWAQPIPSGFTAELPVGRDAWLEWVLDLRDAVISAYPTDPTMVAIGGDVFYTRLDDSIHDERLLSFGDADDEFALLRDLDRARAEHLEQRERELAKLTADSPCPCGSGDTVRSCHPAVIAVADRAGSQAGR